MQLLRWAVNKDTDMGCRDYRIKLFNNIYKDLSFFRCWVPTGVSTAFLKKEQGRHSSDGCDNYWSWGCSQSVRF